MTRRGSLTAHSKHPEVMTVATSREFDANYNTQANWSGVEIKKGQTIRRWVIEGEESYEPTALNDVLNGLEDGRAGKVRNPEHALHLVEEHGRKNVFFVTKVNPASINKKRRKGSWSDAEFRNYIGQHAKFFILSDSVEVRDDEQIIRDLIEQTADDRRTADYARRYAERKRDEDDLDVTDQEIEQIIEKTEFDAWTPAN